MVKVLVTGGTGVAGEELVTQLVERGHEVRLFGRDAMSDARRWPSGVEGRLGDVALWDTVDGCADGCDAVVHLAAIVRESPPDATFDEINVGGTRNILREAERAGVPRFVHLSALGAERGESEFLRSKYAAEQLVHGYPRSWTILRPGNVYGRGDEDISLLLRMVRSLPAIPVIGGDDVRLQPLWARDLALAIVHTVERTDLSGRVLELVGPNEVTVNELIDRLCDLADRTPLRVPLPDAVASFGVRIAAMLGADLPAQRAQLALLDGGSPIIAPQGNALTTTFGLTPTPLREGLRELADAQPDQLPEQGVGRMHRKLFWANIVGSDYTPEELFALFRARFSEITPWQMDVGAEPGTPTVPLREGETITMALPMRGHVQVRVRELTSQHLTLVTVAGHPLAGAVRFTCEPNGPLVRFEIRLYTRAANLIDWLLLHPVGSRLQESTWIEIVERVVRVSGGTAPRGVQQESESLDEEDAALVGSWLEGLVIEGERAAHEARREERELRPRPGGAPPPA